MAVRAQNYNQLPNFINGNNVWCFGDRAGIDFTGGVLTPIVTAEEAIEGMASVSDTATGELLFYSSGSRVRNRNHQIMPNGNGLLGASSSTAQGVCIVPMIGQPGKFYLFSLSGLTDGGPIPGQGTLFYSIIDMSLDNGLGDVVTTQKNILLDADTLSEAMIAVPGNNCDIWLMVHTVVDPIFKAYHITAAGIDPVPVISTSGSQIQGGSFLAYPAYTISTMTISPDRSKLALSAYGSPVLTGVSGLSGVLVSEFDPGSGMVSNTLLVDQLDMVAYNAAFSPDNTKLYFLNENLTNTVYELLQYDISSMNAATIAASKEVISSPVLPYDMCQASYMRLYNGKIYVPYSGRDTMGIINQPDLSGVSCDFDPNVLQLVTTVNPPTHVMYALTNETVFPFPPDTSRQVYLDTVICKEQPGGIQLQLTAESGFGSYLWDDGSTGSSRTVGASGIYWVLCKDDCHSRADTFRVGIINVLVTLGNDTTLCAGSLLLLQPGIPEPETALLWQDGSTGQSYEADQTGLYWVKATKGNCTHTDSIRISIMNDLAPDLGDDISFCEEDPIAITLFAGAPANGSIMWNTGSTDTFLNVTDTGTYTAVVTVEHCTAADSIHIGREKCSCFLATPSAFSPNGDGLNDKFSPLIDKGCPVSNYRFSIYNRFGERVFSSADPSRGWDGTRNGTPVDVGTYMYEVHFRGGTRLLEYYRKGDVVLLR